MYSCLAGFSYFCTPSVIGSVVQWIVRESPELKIQVRFLAQPQSFLYLALFGAYSPQNAPN